MRINKSRLRQANLLILSIGGEIKTESDFIKALGFCIDKIKRGQAKLEENTKLKELLKECKHIMSIEKDFASCHFEKDKLCKLFTKINQVLGEE